MSQLAAMITGTAAANTESESEELEEARLIKIILAALGEDELPDKEIGDLINLALKAVSMNQAGNVAPSSAGDHLRSNGSAEDFVEQMEAVMAADRGKRKS